MLNSREDENRGLRVFVFCSLVPGAAYFFILMLALFGVPGPARWLVELLSGVWAAPLLWAVVIGGPMLSAIGALILNARERTDCRLDRFFGGFAAGLLILNLLSCIPFPYILAVE